MATLGGPALWVELIQSDDGDRVIEIPVSDLVSFEFVDTDMGTDVAKLSLKNDDMKWYDEAAFRAGQKLLVTWGWENAMCTPRRMVVKKPSKGSSPIIITLHDEGTLLDKVPKKRQWGGKSDAQIVSAIADDNEYKGILQDIAETVAVREGTTQIGTDAAFLTTLARRNGFRWWVDGMGLHWGPRPTGANPSASFIYRHDLKGNVLEQPQIEANLSKDIAMVKVVAIDPLTRQEVTATVGVDEGDETLGEYLENIISLGTEEEISNPDNPDGARSARVSRGVEINMGSATAEEVATEAERIYTETAMARYKMTVPVLGNPVIGAKQLHHWTMPSETMSGLWYCKKAITTITPGSYRIALHYVKDALGKLFLKKLHPVSRKKNTAAPELDENGVPVNKDGLEKVETFFEENGQLVPAWHYVDSNKSTVGKATAMTTEDIAGLSSKQRLELAKVSQGAVILPGK